MNEAQVRRCHVFGETAVKGSENRFANRSSLLQDVVIPEAEDRVALRTHEFVAVAVIGAVGVLGAVYFDDERLFTATKISEISADRELTREFIAAKLSALQFEPQHRLGFVAAGT
jgi:hypothetical protein